MPLDDVLRRIDQAWAALETTVAQHLLRTVSNEAPQLASIIGGFVEGRAVEYPALLRLLFLQTFSVEIVPALIEHAPIFSMSNTLKRES
jgi:hypothetical protein